MNKPQKISELKEGEKNVVLHVKVVSKRDIFESKIGQRMFSAYVQDSSGEQIKCTYFDGSYYGHHDQCEYEYNEREERKKKFDDLFSSLENGNFYEISGGKCKYSNYSKKNELSFGEGAFVEKIKEFPISAIEEKEEKEFVTKDNFEEQKVGDYINFKGKLTAQYEKKAFRNGNGFLKNAYFVGAKATLFNEFADKPLEVGKSYSLTNVKIGEYNGKKNFSTTRNTVITEIKENVTGNKRKRDEEFGERPNKRTKY